MVNCSRTVPPGPVSPTNALENATNFYDQGVAGRVAREAGPAEICRQSTGGANYRRPRRNPHWEPAGLH